MTGWDRFNEHNHSKFINWHVRGPYEKLPNCLRELLSDNEKEARKRTGLSESELEDLELKLVELKEIAKKNYIVVSKMKGHKNMKRTWVKAINRLPANWSFNTFVVGITSNKKHILNGQMDVLLMIQKFM